MCKMLLSIKPEFVDRIFDGTKRFEFRKVKCNSKVDSILIYETAPTMRVVGEAKIKDVLAGSPEEIWNKTSFGSGISKVFFDEYYQGKKIAVAYELDDIRRYKNPKFLLDYGVSSAPQSFVYVG